MICLQFIVSGRVQGVFFRQSTRTEALRLGITGWVRNLPDGRVELVASGPDEAMAGLRAWLSRGPPRAVVTEVIANTAMDEGWISFDIR